MKQLHFLVVLLLSSAAFGQWQNCSYGKMNQTGQSGGCNQAPQGTPWPNQDIGWTGTTTYADSCINKNTGASYFNANSTVTGYGGCQYANAQWIQCPAAWSSNITNATSTSDYNRMYNYAYDYGYNGGQINGAPPGTYGGGSCVATGVWRQDMQQCDPITCQNTCSGNPDFTCCNGGPTCEPNGEYDCGASGGMCYFSNVPTDCTAGQSPQCQCDGSWQCVNNPGTPIIIDTNGRGFQLTNAANGVRFALDPSRPAEQLSWTMAGSRNGWLALPHNGKVESGADLFGNFTPQPPSSDPNGFLALAVYDQPQNGGNGDGIIDWHDSVFGKLRVWIDENHNGKAEANELYTLPAVGVYSISLTYTESKFTDNWGNQFRLKGTINPTGNPAGDHVDRVIYDVFLESAASCEGKKIGIDPLMQFAKDPLKDKLQ